jgi:acyl-CoA reductase-like NAD-dependent aldehyde dehydrogenase
VADRALILNRIADRIMDNPELLAVTQTWDNGKPVRATLAADIPLAADHFPLLRRRRPCSGRLAVPDRADTTAYPYHEPLGVVGHKSSGIGRENHLMMLDHYQQTKNLLVSHSENKLGFF